MHQKMSQRMTRQRRSVRPALANRTPALPATPDSSMQHELSAPATGHAFGAIQVYQHSAPSLQLTRKSKGIEYATDRDDALAWLKANVREFPSLPEEDQEFAINLACDAKQGVAAAKQAITAPDMEAQIAKRRTEREAAINTDYQDYRDSFGNNLTNIVFDVAKAGFVTGNQNVTVAWSYPQEEVDAAMDAWLGMRTDGDLTDNITNVHGFRRQDKAAAGKGNVGATLATRKIQANFISTWLGRTINVHVDIDE